MATHDNGPAVSIVMPIYNPGEFLFQSMDSVMNQTFAQIQIVCVNDGSTDGSLTLLREYAKCDRRVLVIDKPNGGYGHAMNVGMSAATGEYVMILEPDDFMEYNMVEALYSTAKELDCDVVKSNYWSYKGSTGTNEFTDVLFDKTCGIVTSALEDPKVVLIRPCIWTAIYRRQLLVDNAIRFNETPGAAYQDTAFAFKVLSSAKRISFLHDAYLHYRIDNEASSVKSSGKIYNVCDEFAAMESFICTRRELRAHLMPILQVLKFDTYMWNLNRIADQYKAEFRDRLSLELLKAEYDGFLKRELFDDARWEGVQACIRDYRTPHEA